jgi:N6-L-threonylcarbamoyladenine synthase/protein kinase Bud32
MRLLYKGAEATLWVDDYLGLKVVRKQRLAKSYRQASLDSALARQRARNEARMLSRARCAVRTPRVLGLDGDELVMEFVAGQTVKEAFRRGDVSAAREMGEAVRRLHDAGIVHNDLTTSNFIAARDGLCVVDFGLAAVSKSDEDRAVDLVVFKKMLSSSHYDVFEKAWREFVAGYSPGEGVLAAVQRVEERVKYR